MICQSLWKTLVNYLRTMQNYRDANSVSIQNDLNNLTEWSLTWQLPFNYGKCKCLHIGNSNLKYDYVMHGRTLNKVDCEKDLGVEVDSELKFHKQTSNSVKKANRMLGLIKRCFQNKKEETFSLLYMALVRTPSRIRSMGISLHTESESS